MDYDSLSSATRPLFYISYSLYWTLVMAPVGNGSGGVFLFCDNATMYDLYFRAPRMMLEGSMMAIQESLTRILMHDPKDECHPHQHMEMILSRHLWFGCQRSIHILKESYIEHRDKCFSTSGQHWSFIEFLHQTMSLTMAVCGYIHVIAEMFLPEVAEHVYPILEDVCENLANMRNEGSLRLSTFSSSTTETSHDGFNPYRPPSVSCAAYNDVNEFTMGKYSMGGVPRGMAQMESFSDDSVSPASRAAQPEEEEPQSHAYPGTIDRYTFARLMKRNKRETATTSQIFPPDK
jgi:hypothetical protein